MITLKMNAASRRWSIFSNEDCLTWSGQTAARSGVPHSSGETLFDRYTRQQNDRIDNSICQGCSGVR